MGWNVIQKTPGPGRARFCTDSFTDLCYPPAPLDPR